MRSSNAPRLARARATKDAPRPCTRRPTGTRLLPSVRRRPTATGPTSPTPPTTQHIDQQKEHQMGSRAEHKAIAQQALIDGMKAARDGDEKTYQREKFACIAHEHAARDGHTHDEKQGR